MWPSSGRPITLILKGRKSKQQVSDAHICRSLGAPRCAVTSGGSITLLVLQVMRTCCPVCVLPPAANGCEGRTGGVVLLRVRRLGYRGRNRANTPCVSFYLLQPLGLDALAFSRNRRRRATREPSHIIASVDGLTSRGGNRSITAAFTGWSRQASTSLCT